MATGRRTIDRRRRVLYSAQQSGVANPTAATRREAERLRAARRPTAMYGERVQRRLSGRWFSLVPVQGRTFSIAASAIASATLVLCLLNYLAVTWPKLIYAPEISRVFRLDRSDSFGNWYQSVLLATAAGIALLTYQLRRYRLDDYRGQYRLWRTVLIATAVCSLGTSLSLVEWLGECLDALFGKRVALAGADWVRLVVSVGGAVLALRLIAEIYRSRWALAAMLVAIAAFAVPEAAGWNMIEISSAFRWSLVESAPLVGCTALVLALGRYLRLLYREVCEIEDGPSLKEKLASLRFSVRRPDEDGQDDDSSEPDAREELEKKPRWWHRKEKPEPIAEADEKPTAEPADEQKQDAEPQTARKRRFGLGLRRQAKDADAPEAKEDSAPETDNEESEPAPKKRGLGLGGFLKRKPKPEPIGEAEADDSVDAPPQPAPQENEADQSPGEDDEIDWDSLSKAERRRLRKELKRKGRAA